MLTWLITVLTLTKVDRICHKETKHRRPKTSTWLITGMTQTEVNEITKFARVDMVKQGNVDGDKI